MISARRLEIDYFRKMGVYRKVSRDQVKAMKGKVISTKWLDTNKGDTATPNYRSRLVGREIARNKRLDLFSATPPLESFKILMSKCASAKGRKRIAVIDIKRAYFYAPAVRPIFIEIPDEDRDANDVGLVGQLMLSLYGTRDASQNWTSTYTKLMIELGFSIGAASPCNFTHAELDIDVTVHGDDFMAVGSKSGLKWLELKMKAKFEAKVEVLGPDPDELREVRILNRIIRWENDGLCYEADQRHAELAVKELGLENCKAVTTPGCRESCVDNVDADGEGQTMLGPDEAKSFRSITARINFLAQDRADIQYACKCVCSRMASPRESDWLKLKRIGRYLKGKPRMVQKFMFIAGDGIVRGYCDSDWAGDRSNMKSTSGGVILIGGSVVKTWSTSQSVIALSSAEAELYAITKMAIQTLAVIAQCKDFRLEAKGEIRTDSSAAMGIAFRQGLGGKARHIKVQYLWIQEGLRHKEFSLEKVGGEYNVADILTKNVSTELLSRHLDTMHFSFLTGRALKSSQLFLLQRILQSTSRRIGDRTVSFSRYSNSESSLAGPRALMSRAWGL